MDPTAPANSTPTPIKDLLTLPLAGAFGEVADTTAAIAAWHHASGTHPHAHEAMLDGTVGPGDLSADGFEVVSSHVAHDGASACVVVDGDWVAHIRTTADHRVCLAVYGRTTDAASSGIEALTAVVRPPAQVRAGDVPILFRHQGPHGPVTDTRPVDAPEFAEIADNYRHDTRDALVRLTQITRPETAAGRLVLLHGPPGTGKTTAVRALARAWQPWCDTSYVLDPEVLFSDANYLHKLMLESPRDDDGRWHLVVIEDADEIISTDAKLRAGQALSRLLSLTDGILGRGLRVLVLVTTNEPVTDLHPAATRPGRCLAEIEVGPLPRAQAIAWLAEDPYITPPERDATLAELYALKESVGPVRTRSDRFRPSPGSYL